MVIEVDEVAVGEAVATDVFEEVEVAMSQEGPQELELEPAEGPSLQKAE